MVFAIRLAADVRNSQKEYFLSRRPDALQKAQSLERKLDKLLGRMLAAPTEVQYELFDQDANTFYD